VGTFLRHSVECS